MQAKLQTGLLGTLAGCGKVHECRFLRARVAFFRNLLVAVAAFSLVSCSHGSANAEKVAELKDALKNGVITQQEYDAKIAQFPIDTSSVDPKMKAALDKARKDGLLTQEEYDAKLRALSAASANSSGGGSGTVLAASPQGGSNSGGVRKETIRDPSYNMTAFDVTLPANWKFQATFIPGTSCFQAPFPVVRAYSPDGLTEWRRYPRTDWNWSNLPAKAPPHPDCLNLQQALSAKDFLKYSLGVLQMAYVRDGTVPQAGIDAKQKFLDQLNASAVKNSAILRQDPSVQTASFAEVFGEYRNGSYTIEARLLSEVDCIRTPIPVFNQKGMFAEACNATLGIVRAPKGQLAGLLKQFESEQIGVSPNSDWVTRYLTEFRQNSERMAQQRHEEFQRAQLVRAQQHQEFMATLQRGTDASMAHANEIANARHTIASDWCDYSLDQQTVTGADGTMKVSSAYTQTWMNGRGEYFQTNVPNANPNGVFSGNWTPATKVHGDGTPY